MLRISLQNSEVLVQISAVSCKELSISWRKLVCNEKEKLVQASVK